MFASLKIVSLVEVRKTIEYDAGFCLQQSNGIPTSYSHKYKEMAVMTCGEAAGRRHPQRREVRVPVQEG
jgi:predicted metal-binding protein